MSDRFPPALTAAEWRALRANPGGSPAILLQQIQEERGLGALLHAQAALALLDQPFGFNWEDVDRCNELAVRDEEVAALQWVREYRSGWRDLADRVAALMPPRVAAIPAEDSIGGMAASSA